MAFEAKELEGVCTVSQLERGLISLAQIQTAGPVRIWSLSARSNIVLVLGEYWLMGVFDTHGLNFGIMHTSSKAQHEVKKAFLLLAKLNNTQVVNSNWNSQQLCLEGQLFICEILSFVRCVYCTNHVWEIRNILKYLYANLGFHLYYVHIPRVEKGLHKVLDVF